MGQMVARVIDWEDRLADFGTRMLGLPYQWANTDCVALGLQVFNLLYDAEEKPWWHDEQSAIKAMAEEWPSTWIRKHGGQTISNLRAQTGDIFLGTVNKQPSLYIAIGSKALTSTPDEGVHCVDVADLMHSDHYNAWRLP